MKHTVKEKKVYINNSFLPITFTKNTKGYYLMFLIQSSSYNGSSSDFNRTIIMLKRHTRLGERCKWKFKISGFLYNLSKWGGKPDKHSLIGILEWYICFLFMLFKPPILIYSKNVFNQDPLPLGTSFHFIVLRQKNLPRGRYFPSMILINWSSSWKMLKTQNMKKRKKGGCGEKEKSVWEMSS